MQEKCSEREYKVFWIPWSTGCVFLRHALQCGLLHLWVCDFMVSMLTGHLEGVGVLGGPLSPRCRRGGVSPVENLVWGRKEGRII